MDTSGTSTFCALFSQVCSHSNRKDEALRYKGDLRQGVTDVKPLTTDLCEPQSIGFC